MPAGPQDQRAAQSCQMLLGTHLVPGRLESEPDDPFLSFLLAILVSVGRPWGHLSSRAQRKFSKSCKNLRSHFFWS